MVVVVAAVAVAAVVCVGGASSTETISPSHATLSPQPNPGRRTARVVGQRISQGDELPPRLPGGRGDRREGVVEHRAHGLAQDGRRHPVPEEDRR